jgi:hypothetical protein
MAEFILTGPPWMLADESSIRKDPATGAFDVGDGALFLTAIVDGANAASLFTDRDLAERAAQEHGGRYVPVVPRSPQDLVKFLQILQAAGVDRVCLDPTTKKKPITAAISEVIEEFGKLT